MIPGFLTLPLATGGHLTTHVYHIREVVSLKPAQVVTHENGKTEQAVRCRVMRSISGMPESYIIALDEEEVRRKMNEAYDEVQTNEILS